MTYKQFVVLVLIAGLSACQGCGGEEGVPTYPVTGTVTQKGKPVEGAIVSFTPIADGKSASAVSDASGKYSLTTNVSGDGAQEGQYNVTIAKYATKLPEKATPNTDAEADPYDITDEYAEDYNEMEESEKAAAIARNLLPEKYANPSSSKLVATVSATGPNTHDFKLD